MKKELLPNSVYTGYTDAEILLAKSNTKKERMKKANIIFETAKKLKNKSLLTEDQFKIFCLRHGLNKMRERLNFSAISAILNLHVEIVLEEYVKALGLIKNNKNSHEINKL